MNWKKIIIVGGTRGFGFELAKEFVSLGAHIVITGRRRIDAEEAARKIAQFNAYPGKVDAAEADINSFTSLVKLQAEALTMLGSIDILVVNAGISQTPAKAWLSNQADIAHVLSTDLIGPMYAVRAFMPRMVSEGYGSIWFIEGLGSNGMQVERFSLYGTSKRGLAYYWRALAKESEGTGVSICALSPGMMITDFLMDNLNYEDKEKRAKTIRLYNILADKPGTVAHYSAPKIISNRRNGRLVKWLTTPKVIVRFLCASFLKRDIVSP